MKQGARKSSESSSPLKKLRVMFAAAFFAFACLAFLDIHHYAPVWVRDQGLFLQFTPSLLRFLFEFSLAASGFIVVLALTLLLGRIYCSAICPLGVLMDIFSRLRKRSGAEGRRKYNPPHSYTRWAIFALTVAAVVSGTMLVVNILDPFSIFGRMAASLAKPLVMLANNAAAFALENYGYYFLPPYELKILPWSAAAFSLAFLVVIFWLAYTKDRLYCNMICPVGALLGLVSKLSVFKIRIDGSSCIKCGQCERRCKAGCIDSQSKTIDHDRCVACFNCLSPCPVDAISFSRRKWDQTEKVDESRRMLLAGAAGLTGLAPASARGSEPIKITVPNKIRVPEIPHPILPPGALGLNHFTAKCTACHACVANCPSRVLQAGIADYGLSGLFMPRLDPSAGYCNINCNICGQVCPAGAITTFSIEEKKRIQVGKARFIRENCIVVLQGTACGACSEHCPTKAVYMVKEEKQMVPRVNEEICLGCGACEHVCPAKPNRAIYVEPNTIHLAAKPPVSAPPKKDGGGIKEFPF